MKIIGKSTYIERPKAVTHSRQKATWRDEQSTWLWRCDALAKRSRAWLRSWCERARTFCCRPFLRENCPSRLNPRVRLFLRRTLRCRCWRTAAETIWWSVAGCHPRRRTWRSVRCFLLRVWRCYRDRDVGHQWRDRGSWVDLKRKNDWQISEGRERRWTGDEILWKICRSRKVAFENRGKLRTILHSS